MTDGGGRASEGSWQRDPTGRYEQRWRLSTGEWTNHVWSGGELGSDPFNASPAPSGKPRRSLGRKLLIAFGIAVALIVVLAVIGSFIEPEPDSDEAVQTTTETQATATTTAATATTTAAATANEPDQATPETVSAETTITAAEPTSDDTEATQATVAQTSSNSEEASLQLQVAAEHDPGYDRDDWGPHNSSLCSGAVGSPDPYTGTAIDTCHVDHVVALDEAHESGGWQWPAGRKQQFSQDPANHVASRACVNQSKGGDDIYEWSDASISSSSACGGGYTVTASGRCFLARTTVAVKAAWGLAVDQEEAEALNRTLARCGDEALALSDAPQDTTSTATPTTTVAVAVGECVITGRSAAEFDVVYGIGEVLAPRLASAQPFTSIADLDAVSGIGPVKANAVWTHFCSESASTSSATSQETAVTAAPTTAPPTTAAPTTAPPTTAAPRHGCTHWHAGHPKHTHFRGGPHSHTHAPSSRTKCGWIFQ